MATVRTRFLGAYKVTTGMHEVCSLRHGHRHVLAASDSTVKSGNIVTVLMESDPEAETKCVTTEDVTSDQLTGCVCVGSDGKVYVSTLSGWVPYDAQKHQELLVGMIFQTTKVAYAMPKELPNGGGTSKCDIPPLEAGDLESLTDQNR